MTTELKIGTTLVSIHRGSVVQAATEAIVNAANDQLTHGAGLCGAIYAAAGSQLDTCTEKMGGCPTGQAKITPAFKLKTSQYIIHAVGPFYNSSEENDCRQLLAKAYKSSLELAEKQGLKSIGLPSLSTGIYGYPIEKATPEAVQAVVHYLQGRTTGSLSEVKFYLYHQQEYDIFIEALVQMSHKLKATAAVSPKPLASLPPKDNVGQPPIADSYWVTPGNLLAGEYPGAKDNVITEKRLEKFVTAGIRVFIDLTRPDDRDGKGLSPYNPILQRLAIKKDLQLTYINSPILDQHILAESQMTEILTLLDFYITQQKPVYVHCWGGIGRTGTVVSCYLIDRQGLSAKAAIEAMNQLRSKTTDAWKPSPQSHAQEQFIQDWAIRQNSKPNQPKNENKTPIYFYNKDQPYYSFTNFAHFGFELDGYYWKTSEHYFQAQKFKGTIYFDEIRNLEFPGEVFDRAQELKKFVPTNWGKVKDGVMRKAVLAKFEANPEIRAELLSTGTRPLIENSPKDSYWGIGKEGNGKNRLGQILMEVRDILR